jgi:hypothetical protein
MTNLALEHKIFRGQPRQVDLPEGWNAYREVRVTHTRKGDGSFETDRVPTSLYTIAPNTTSAREAFNTFRGDSNSTARQVVY